MKPGPLLDQSRVDAFDRDGAVFIPGLFAEWVDLLRAGVEQNMAEPGPYASENYREGASGRFFDDYCNWNRIEAFETVIRQSDVAAVAALLMRSDRVQLFHDHVLVKEPGTTLATPWHQDAPYYFVDGQQTVSFWCPLDPVNDSTLRLVAGSHRWEKPVQPIRWATEKGFYEGDTDYRPIPDPDAEGMQILEWAMQPGDAVAFDFRVLHGARGNLSAERRRAFSLRLVGDDARYLARPGRTSPPYPGHGMRDGDRLREDWFPVIYSAGSV